MKRIFLLTFVFLVVVSNTIAFSQKSQLRVARNSIGKLQVAINNQKDNKAQLDILGEGVKAAEAAQNDRKTRKWSETWAIKAYLSSYVSILDGNEGNSDRYYGLAIAAIDSAKRLDRFDDNARLIEASIYNINIKKQNKANNAYKNNDFTTAFNLLKEVSDFFPKDTSLAINTALSAQNIRAFDNALIYFRRAKDNGAKDPAIFQTLSKLYTSKFEHENAIKSLEEGITVNPYNTNLTNDYINLLLDSEKYPEAIHTIEQNLKATTNNKLLFFLYGYLQQKGAGYHTAQLAYNRALELDENYFDALYQLGLAYVDSANEALKAKTPDSNQKFAGLVNRAEVALLQAHEINQNDKSTVELLIEIYTRKNKLDKVQELKSKLEEF
ncbi:tetratricopeptide repeat protein [Pedobacter sp. JCM 36344]|uniref:tetratricopeptide repeat protein n=1 Tax=Pedobacter sp. JCM 36344 TaxID=3374280 RepID=UPI00397CDE22